MMIRPGISSLKTDPAHTAFSTGPYPTVKLPPWPEDLIRLMEHYTGQEFTPALFELYERLRLFTAYEGPALTPQLELHRFGSPSENTTSFVPPSIYTPLAPEVGGINPLDLGD